MSIDRVVKLAGKSIKKNFIAERAAKKKSINHVIFCASRDTEDQWRITINQEADGEFIVEEWMNEVTTRWGFATYEEAMKQALKWLGEQVRYNTRWHTPCYCIRDQKVKGCKRS